jgi:hypothetical protein
MIDLTFREKKKLTSIHKAQQKIVQITNEIIKGVKRSLKTKVPTCGCFVNMVQTCDFP